MFLFLTLLMGCQHKPDKNINKDDPPNIILIMADDLGYETLGTYGSDDYITPNLDRRARIDKSDPSHVPDLPGKTQISHSF